MEARLAADGHESVAVEDAPDCIVVRGCSVTARAQRDCEKEIARLRRVCPNVVVVGCLPNAVRELRIESHGPRTTRHESRTSRAYLKIQDGCGGKCAFCIVPQFRGAPVSVPFAEVVARAKAFLAGGYRELVVAGCNLALYRNDGKGLADVLAALAELVTPDGSAHRVRLGSFEPGICDEAVLNAFAAHGNLCRHLHVSLQSGSDSVLRRMRRPYGVDAVERFCSALRDRFGGDFALGADVIAGFPGETDSEFAATRRFLARHDFAHLHAFPYSERPGTPAATMPNPVPENVRNSRRATLVKDADERLARFAGRFVGREVLVCVEKDGYGWTGEYLRCGPFPVGLRRSLARFLVRGLEGRSLT